MKLLIQLGVVSRYTAQTDEIVRDLLKTLEGATDEARTALVQHDLPGVIEAMHPSRPPELPERARRALMEDFVAYGAAMQLREASEELIRQRDKVCATAVLAFQCSISFCICRPRV